MTKIIAVIALFCAFWVIYDVWVNNKNKSSEAKLIWTAGAVFFSILTAVVYYLAEKRKM